MTSEAEPVAMGPGATELGGSGQAAQEGSSGDTRVDAALARLRELSGAPVAEHVGVFAAVHRDLQDVLTALGEEAAEPPTPGSPGAGSGV